MTAALIPFETRTAREQRLYRECEAAYFAHLTARTPASREVMTAALHRWGVARTLAGQSGSEPKRHDPYSAA